MTDMPFFLSLSPKCDIGIEHSSYMLLTQETCRAGSDQETGLVQIFRSIKLNNSQRHSIKNQPLFDNYCNQTHIYWTTYSEHCNIPRKENIKSFH